MCISSTVLEVRAEIGRDKIVFIEGNIDVRVEELEKTMFTLYWKHGMTKTW
jgi:hypothetical protein